MIGCAVIMIMIMIMIAAMIWEDGMWVWYNMWYDMICDMTWYMIWYNICQAMVYDMTGLCIPGRTFIASDCRFRPCLSHKDRCIPFEDFCIPKPVCVFRVGSSVFQGTPPWIPNEDFVFQPDPTKTDFAIIYRASARSDYQRRIPDEDSLSSLCLFRASSNTSVFHLKPAAFHLKPPVFRFKPVCSIGRLCRPFED